MSILTLAATGILLASSPLMAQADISWQFDFDTPLDDEMFPAELVTLPNGGVAVVGASVPQAMSTSTRRQVMVTFSANGDRLWSFSVDNPLPNVTGSLGCLPFGAADIDVDADGNIYLLVSKSPVSVLYKFQPDGTIEWLRTTETGGPHTDHLVLDSAGQPIVSGATLAHVVDRPELLLRKFDTDGQLLWQREFIDLGYPVALRVGPLDEIGLLWSSDSTCFPAPVKYGVFNADGTTRWSRFSGFGSVAADIAFDATGTFLELSAGLPGFFVERFDTTSGSPLGGWFSSAPGGAFPVRIVVDPAGPVYVGGRRNPAFGSPEIAIWRFDSSASTPAWTWSSPSPNGGFVQHGGITLDAGGNVFMSVTADNRIVDVSVAPDGSTRWTQEREFGRVRYHDNGGPKTGVDARGNWFALTRALRLGNPDHSSMLVTKIVDGGPIGTSYCGPAVPNSTGNSGVIRAHGSDGVSVNNVSLIASDLPVGSFALFLTSMNQGSVPLVGGGQGTLCLGGAIGRYVAAGQIRRAGNDGRASLQLELTTVPQPTGLASVAVGETWNFQAWYRDANPVVTSNLTDAVAVLLQ